MHTLTQIAKTLGCPPEQVRAQLLRNIEQLQRDSENARLSKNGKLRGLSAEWYAGRAAHFKKVLDSD